MAEITLASQIKSVEREIAIRKSVYPARVSARAMKQETAGDEIAAMEAVLATLRSLERRTEPCPDGCNHTDAERIAFDAGVAAGERDEACPHCPDNLREAWLAGYSVGSMNGGENESITNDGA